MRRKITTILTLVIIISAQLIASSVQVLAANNERMSVDVTKDTFMFSICDGPDISKLPAGTVVDVTIKGKPEKITPETAASRGYVACDFNAVVDTVQHFIDILIVAGVFVFLGSFCYIGYLYMTGTQDNIKKAKSMLPKIFFGFIMMLAAWFIVYQIMDWLGASEGFKTLLK